MKLSVFFVALVLFLSSCQSTARKPVTDNLKALPTAASNPSESTASAAPSPALSAAAAAASPSIETKTTLKPDPDGRYVNAKIVKVVDGDTMNVLLDKKQETIRLLLVDTPETVHPQKPVEPFGPEASKFAKDTLLSGQDVKLEIDVSERDKYGRLLCYLWINDKLFNEMLLEKGLARVAYVYPPNIKYVDQFREIQKKAQNSGVGIWSIENYAQADGFHDEAAAKPAPTTQPAKKTAPSQTPSANIENGGNVYYKNCTAAKAAGAAPLHKGDPGYSTKLDRDSDGIACE
jgi:micrococcal nuclease